MESVVVSLGFSRKPAFLEVSEISEISAKISELEFAKNSAGPSWLGRIFGRATKFGDPDVGVIESMSAASTKGAAAGLTPK